MNVNKIVAYVKYCTNVWIPRKQEFLGVLTLGMA